MTDLTDDRVRALAHRYRFAKDDHERTIAQTAAALLAARAELARVKADAAVAVALMVERAATQADPWDGPVTKNKIVDAQAIAAQQIKARIRALAPADGLAAVEALRVEARENAMQALASMGQAQEAYEAQLEAEAELARNKTLAAENQRLRDRERVLVEALASRLTANERRVLFTLVNEGVHRNEVGSEKSIQWLRRNGLIERDGGIASKLGGSSVAYWSYVMTDLGNMVHAALATDAEKAGGV